MNILFLNVGRRVELVEAFKKALSLRGGGKVIGTDINLYAPGLRVVDCPYILPPGNSVKWKESFFSLIEKEKISLVIPTIDPDLTRLDSIRKEFSDLFPKTTLLISPQETIKICRNKVLTREKFYKIGLHVPIAIDPLAKDIDFPVFGKPPDGSSSEGAGTILNSYELERRLNERQDLMIEKIVEGPEFTVDVFCNKNSKPLCAIPRKRIKTRSGEVIVGVVELDQEVMSLSCIAAESFGIIGPCNVQFRREFDGRFFAMELNPRFGGGTPLSIAAGADLAGWTIDLFCLNKSPETSSITLQDGIIMSRCDRSFFFKEGECNYYTM